MCHLERVLSSSLTNLEFISIDAPEFDFSEITDPVNLGELLNCSHVTGVQVIGHGKTASCASSLFHNYEATVT